jgi:hypothetical protein
MGTPPILANKLASASSVFTPAALLREARRQKGLQGDDFEKGEADGAIDALAAIEAVALALLEPESL